jgi:hypothetical protein
MLKSAGVGPESDGGGAAGGEGEEGERDQGKFGRGWCVAAWGEEEEEDEDEGALPDREGKGGRRGPTPEEEARNQGKSGSRMPCAACKSPTGWRLLLSITNKLLQA